MLLCQFLVLAGNRFWFYIAVVVLVITTGKKKVPVVCLAGCAVVSVFGSGDYDRKKKRYSHLSGGLCCCVSVWFWWEIGSFFVVAGKFYYNRKEKIQLRFEHSICINST